MLELATILQEKHIMPADLIDTWWFLLSTTTVVLLGMVVFFLKRLVRQQDKMNERLTELLVMQKGTDTELKSHINNSVIHCNAETCRRAIGG